MLFNSLVFFAFLIVVCAVYFALGTRKAQNRFLLVASYVFYGWWDWRFLGLIALSTVVDYAVGQAMKASNDDRKRLRLVRTSVGVNLGILAVFKYFGFFAESTIAALNSLGLEADPVTVHIVLPVGISFYTFQTLSYSIDVYRRKLKPCDDFLDFALFVSFFPQLVAGPIERASALLPQIAKRRQVNWGQIDAGLHLILWGLAKKVVIADNAAIRSDRIFNDMTAYTGGDLVVGALAFTIQIYCDFSGYSDIARGVAKILGFDLMVNFKVPYFARNPSDFWQRWHVSLSSWLRDYLYISLGGNRNGTWMTYRNLALTMLLGGLWHGAAWNFVAWGAFHGAILVLYRLVVPLGRDPNPEGGAVAWAGMLWRVPVMFAFTVCGWVLFRASSMGDIVWWFSNASFALNEGTLKSAIVVAALWSPVIGVQLFQQWKGDLLWYAKTWRPLRFASSLALIVAIAIFGQRSVSEFIYFQF